MDSSTEALARVLGRTGDRGAEARPIGRKLDFLDQRLVHPVLNDAECPFKDVKGKSKGMKSQLSSASHRRTLGF